MFIEDLLEDVADTTSVKISSFQAIHVDTIIATDKRGAIDLFKAVIREYIHLVRT